jgi:2-hydroxymuconate-semialdehyde hydrolase
VSRVISTEVGEYVEVDGLRTFFVKKGTGTPLVLVHGASPGACGLVNWGANIDFFADAGFAVYAADQPGFGNTDNPEDNSLEYRVRHTRGFIDAMGLDRYALMGNSQGSYVVARLALEDPRVQRLVLVSSGTLAPPGTSPKAEEMAREHSARLAAYTPSLENMRELSLQTMFRPEVVTDEFVRLRYEMSIGKNFEAQEKRRGTRAPRPIYPELKNLKMPVLLMWGAHDSGVALERSLLLLECIPGAELHVFGAGAHWVQWDERDRFNSIVRDFLAT